MTNRENEQLQLVGLTEIAQKAGVQKAAVSTWRARHADFPEPYVVLHTGGVWLWPQVRDWLQRTGRTFDANLTADEVNRHALARNSRLVRPRDDEVSDHGSSDTE